MWFQSSNANHTMEDPQRVPGAELRPAVVADDFRMALGELLRKAAMEQDADFLRERVRMLAQELMDLKVTQHLGAERNERTLARTGHAPKFSF